MSLPRSILIPAFFALLIPSLFLSGAYDLREGGWAHESSDLQPHPDLVFGTLDNGLRYVFLPHDGVPGRVSMRLIVLAGSMDETEKERGLAHFLEHMAFNGTTHFDEDEITGYFQRLGMEFGSDVNAYTTGNRTVYGLEFYRTDPDLIRQGFSLVRDFAGELLLKQEEVEKERGVILSELRIHDGIGMRRNEAAKAFFFDGMRFPERNPIGLTPIIKNANRQDLFGFYQRLYRPDLMVFVVVGDLEPAEYASRTREFFGPLERPRSPIPKREEGRLRAKDYPRVDLLQIRNSGSLNIQAASIQSAPTLLDSLESRREETFKRLASALFGKRLRERIPRSGGGSSEFFREGSIAAGIASLQLNPQEWERGVVAIDDLVRSTLSGGFDEEELRPFLNGALLDMKIQKAQGRTMDPKLLADELVDALAEGKVFLGYEQGIQLEERFLQEASLSDVDRAFNQIWNPNQMAYFLSGEIQIPGGSRKVASAIRDARKRNPEIQGSVALGPGQLLMEQLRDPETIQLYRPDKTGTVVEERTLPDFNAHLIKFENNVRLNFIQSDLEPGLVRVVVRTGEGLFQKANVPMGLREFALETVFASGTDRYSIEQIGNFISEDVFQFSFDLEDHDAFTFRGITQVQNLEKFFAVLSEFLRNPRFSHEVHRSVRFRAAMNRMQSSVGLGNGMRAFQDHLFATDARFGWGGPDDYRSLRVSHVREFIEEALTRDYVEVSVIGDIKKDAVVKYAAPTFGSLPERRDQKRRFRPNPVAIDAPAGFERLEFTGETHQAVALGLWPVLEESRFQDRLGLLVISRVLEQRMRMLFRERLGMAYSPQAEYLPFPEYPEFSSIRAMVDCAPEHAGEIARALADIAQELALEGMTEDEFIGAINPVQSRLTQSLRNNSTLLNRLLKRAQENPRTIEEMRAVRGGAYLDLDRDTVNALAARVLQRDFARTAAVVPKPFVGVFNIESGASDGLPIIGR